jgi:hypothetical protein
MRGILIGAFLGLVLGVGLIFLLNVFGLWVHLGDIGSMIVGGVIGVVFANVGMLLGGLADDAY